MDLRKLFFELMEYCDLSIQNTNEYAISKCIISHIGNPNLLSLEELSDKAHISQASVHRFIKKVGFSSYEEFKFTLSQIPKHIQTHRKLYSQNTFHSDFDEVTNKLFNNQISNLKETKNNLDMEKLQKIINILKNAKNITFIGDNHSLAIFYTLQLDLIVHNIPTNMYKSLELLSFHVQTLNEDSVALYFNVSPGFITDGDFDILKRAKLNNVKLILFCQDVTETEQDFLSLFNIIYEYGEKGSLNNGYISLFYISTILSEFVYM